MSQQDDKAVSLAQDEIARFHLGMQQNEVRTLHYLGVPYLVLTRSPQLRLKVPLATVNYDDADGDVGFALQLIFTCPEKYPLEIPFVDIVEKRNVSPALEQAMREEIDDTLEKHIGLQMIVPVVYKLQMLLNSQLRRR